MVVALCGSVTGCEGRSHTSHRAPDSLCQSLPVKLFWFPCSVSAFIELERMRDFSASGLGPLVLLLAVPPPFHTPEMLSKQKSGKDPPKKGGSFTGASPFLLKLSQTKHFLINKKGILLLCSLCFILVSHHFVSKPCYSCIPNCYRI